MEEKTILVGAGPDQDTVGETVDESCSSCGGLSKVRRDAKQNWPKLPVYCIDCAMRAGVPDEKWALFCK